ncbi:unnamed protein product [Psylliodes chrysocephalus]|uniref:Uncharacterized protein n=1 Tax=Psylliodes chrysocephalus TaxID=3402493 RepID=A0A9P0GCU1_9CUCU|nr:unnamed protein product [Psylliodes chrysocephala]
MDDLAKLESDVKPKKPKKKRNKFFPKLSRSDSIEPSYTNLWTRPYNVICRQRYRNAGTKQRAQFIKEIEDHEILQTHALDGVRIHREFCNVILSEAAPENIIKICEKDRLRIHYILTNDIT